MSSIVDDRGFNQGFTEIPSTITRMYRRAQWFLDEMQPQESKTVLEIGCGTGLVSDYLAAHSNMKIIGTDLCVPFIEDAKTRFVRPNLSFDVLDFNKPEQFLAQRFDYITGNGILHHLYYHLDEDLKNIYFLLNNGGKMIFMEPNIYNPYIALIFNIPFLRKKANLEPDEMAFSGSFIRSKLQKAGFKNIKTFYRDFLLPGVPNTLVNPLVTIGNVVEKIPVLDHLAQSLFITAEK